MMKAIGQSGHIIRDLQRTISKPIRRSVYDKFTWLNNSINRLSLTVPGRGCRSDTCVMCPLPSYTNTNYTNEIIFQAIKRNIETYKGKIDMLSLYNDGSYYDFSEFDFELRIAIEELVAINDISIFNVETLPSKFPEEEIVETIKRTKATLLINVGLQSSNYDIRKYCIGSPFTESHLSTMMRIKKRHNLKLRGYLLFKPPFLSEYEAILDLGNSIKYCIESKYDIISINPCKVAKGTLLEYLYNNNFYTLSHYFSIAKVLSEMAEINSVRVEMPSSNGCPGDIALPHICKKCSSIWENGKIDKSFTYSPSCWDIHMEREHNSNRWQDSVEKFWKSEAGKFLINKYERTQL